MEKNPDLGSGIPDGKIQILDIPDPQHWCEGDPPPPHTHTYTKPASIDDNIKQQQFCNVILYYLIMPQEQLTVTSQCVEEGDELNQVNFLVCWPTFGFAIKSVDCISSVIRHFFVFWACC
jgi:hypothetical protein